MGTSLISIIVPAYNIENYIEKTVASICAQTYRNLEIILVDDGSTDKTPDCIDGLAREETRIVAIHKENGGVTSARLCGVQAAHGEWIGFVDGDDLLEPDMYERLLRNAQMYNAQISHCGYQMVFPSRVDYYYNTGKLVEQDRETGVRDLLTGKFVEPALWNKLYNKSLFNPMFQNNLMDSTVKNTEDLLMNFYLFREAKKSVYEDFCPYHYVVRAGSAATSKMNLNKLWDPIRVCAILERETADNGLLHNAATEKMVTNLIRICALRMTDCKEFVPYRNKACRELRSRLFDFLKGPYSAKGKIKALWMSVWPASYRLIHYLYLRFTGKDKIYEIK